MSDAAGTFEPTLRPYLVKAIYQWLLDSHQTPLLRIHVGYPGVDIPEAERRMAAKQDQRFVLNISPLATEGFQFLESGMAFQARFGGKPFRIHCPWEAMEAIFGREGELGMVFPLLPPENVVLPQEAPAFPARSSPSLARDRGHLRVIK